MENTLDYAEALFQSMQTLINSSIASLDYDKTVVCNIVSNENRSRGEYLVDDGKSTFLAYSENTGYQVSTSVYVIIPQGNYNNKKIILGRRVNSDSDEYNYVSPMDTYVDITTNIVSNFSLDDEISILANGSQYMKQIPCNIQVPVGGGYDRLGIKADFRTELKEFSPISGDYGIYISIIYRPQGESEQKIIGYRFGKNAMYGDVYNFPSPFTQEAVFDISQLGVIDSISLYLYQNSEFKSYIDNDNHNLDIYIPSKLSDDNNSLNNELPDNIFVKNIYLSLGYSMEDFKEDTVLVYMQDNESSSYKSSSSDEERKRKLEARWIHKTNEGFTSVKLNEMEQYNANISWYNYDLQYDQDGGGNIYWRPITEINKVDNSGAYSLCNIICNPLTQYDYYKAVVKLPSAENIKYAQEIFNTLNNNDIFALSYVNAEQNLLLKNLKELTENYSISWKLENQQKIIDDLNEFLNFFDATNDKIQYNTLIKLIEEFNNFAEYDSYSGTIQLYNTEPVEAALAVDLIQSLSLVVGDDSDPYKGVYNIYGEDRRILNSAISANKQKLVLTYNSLFTGIKEFDGDEKITWKFPLTNTMIQTPQEGKEYNTKVKEGETPDELSYYDDSGNLLTTQESILQKATWLHISRLIKASNTNDEVGDLKKQIAFQFFRIKDYFSSVGRNKIECIVEKGGYKYYTNIILIFGTSGSNGTAYTFRLESDYPAIDYSDRYGSINFTPHLYDYNNQEIDINNINYYYSISTDGSFTEFKSIHIDENKKLSVGKANYDTLDMLLADEEHAFQSANCIIKATITVDPNNRLQTYYPIAQSADLSKYAHYIGPDYIIYNEQGINPQYYKNYIKLYDANDVEVQDIEWSVQIYGSNDTESYKRFYPSIIKNDKDYSLAVPTTYIQGLEGCRLIGKQNGSAVWIQHLLIERNVYGSAFLNNWNGELSINDDNTIMASMIGAGKKDKDNTFSGVLMGDVQSKIDDEHTNTQTGLYGYQKGVQTFALTDDGKAVIGSSGMGQISIDGTGGIIQSGNYKNKESGMKIDLKNGSIDANDFKLTSKLISIDSSANAINYFTVKGIGNVNTSTYTYRPEGLLSNESHEIRNKTNTLINISNNSYYLQTLDFNNLIDQEQGFKLDLSKNTMEAYSGFKLSAINHKIRIDTQAYEDAKFYIRLGETQSYAMVEHSNTTWNYASANVNKKKPEIIFTEFSFQTEKIKVDTLKNYYYWNVEENKYSDDWDAEFVKNYELHFSNSDKEEDKYVIGISKDGQAIDVYKKIDKFVQFDSDRFEGVPKDKNTEAPLITGLMNCELYSATSGDNRISLTITEKIVENNGKPYSTYQSTFVIKGKLQSQNSDGSSLRYYGIRLLPKSDGKDQNLLFSFSEFGLIDSNGNYISSYVQEKNGNTEITLTPVNYYPIFDLYIVPINLYGKGELIFNSNDNQYPLQLKFMNLTPFKLSWAGYLTTSRLNATGGSIGGWTIEDRRLFAGLSSQTQIPRVELSANTGVEIQVPTQVTQYGQITGTTTISQTSGPYISIGTNNAKQVDKEYNNISSDQVTTSQEGAFSDDDINKYYQKDTNKYYKIVSTTPPYYEKIIKTDNTKDGYGGGIQMLGQQGILYAKNLYIEGGGGVWEGFARYTDANSHTHILSGSVNKKSSTYMTLYTISDTINYGGSLPSQIRILPMGRVQEQFTIDYNGNSRTGLDFNINSNIETLYLESTQELNMMGAGFTYYSKEAYDNKQSTPSTYTRYVKITSSTGSTSYKKIIVASGSNSVSNSDAKSYNAAPNYEKIEIQI